MATEARDLMGDPVSEGLSGAWAHPHPLDARIIPMDPAAARDMFIDRAEELGLV